MKIAVIIGSDDTFLKLIIEYWKKNPNLQIFVPYRYKLIGKGNLIKQKITAAYNQWMFSSRHLRAIYEMSDVTFVEWGTFALANLTQKISGEKPLIVRIHRYEADLPILDRVQWKYVTKVLIVNTFIGQKLKTRFPELEGKIQLISNVIDLQRFRYHPRETFSHKVGMMRCDDNKRPDLIVKALPENVTLHIADLVPKKLQQKILKYAKASQIVFDGWVSPEKWFSDKDFLINGSDHEGQPVSVLESAVMGVQPIVRQWPGAQDWYDPSWLCPFNEVDFVRCLREQLRTAYERGFDPRERENISNTYRRIIQTALEQYNTLFDDYE